MTMTATYSPDDNKLRLYASSRLDAETYARVKAAGFKWAPKQDLFVAPMWTPGREDLLTDLCGEVGDEDVSLVERAADRAERFETYSDKRADEAESARRAVDAIADAIPLGQPILVGHHSERHARRDAERIRSGMQKAVKLWQTSEYWTRRAAGAVHHAKYKERPDVRARRIKGIEANQRKNARDIASLEKRLKAWTKVGDYSGEEAHKLAIYIANHEGGSGSIKLADGTDYWSAWSALTDGKIDAASVRAQRLERLPRAIAHCQRWAEHYANRLAYERAMLDAAGGTLAEQKGSQTGGAVRCWAGPRGGWAFIQKVNKVSVTVLDNWGNGGGNFTRTIPFDKLQGIMTAAEVNDARATGRLIETDDKTGFYLRDKPPCDAAETVTETVSKGSPEPVGNPSQDRAEPFEAMQAALKAGVQVVVAPQLFATPPDLAARVVQLAGIEPGHRVLEPNAGTGALLRAIGPGPDKVAVEVNPALADGLLRQGHSGLHVHCADFLQCNGELGTFDRIAMNPPFENATDIRHILHAVGMLRPGGRLVAICANGPRQNEKLRMLASEWHDLPAGTFAGTQVRAALIVIDN